jgi:Flp pilus assembly protein TadG
MRPTPFCGQGRVEVNNSMRLEGEDGVAMTEFALVLPVFIAIIVGLLSFGRLLFYWIDANHLANETARWAVVDRNPNAGVFLPPNALQKYAQAQAGTAEFGDATVCIAVPDDGDPATPREPAIGGPLEVTVEKPFSFVPLKWFDVGTITVRGRSTMRIERFDNGTSPTSYGIGCVPDTSP